MFFLDSENLSKDFLPRCNWVFYPDQKQENFGKQWDSGMHLMHNFWKQGLDCKNNDACIYQQWRLLLTEVSAFPGIAWAY